MYTFDQFLIEAQMSYAEAASILLLSNNQEVTPEILKKAYRKASMYAHPDRGGSNEEMQKVNAAYNVLKNTSRVANRGKENDKEAAKAMAKSLLERIDLGAYNAYLSKLFGVNLRTTDKYDDNYYGINRQVEFASNDRETVIGVRFSFGYSSFMRKQSLGYSDDEGEMLPGEMGVAISILHNRQKMNVRQWEYDVTRSTSVYDDPTAIFAEDKIKKKIQLQDSNQTVSRSGFEYAKRASKMKKRDFIATLSGKFADGEMIKGDVYQIKGNGMTIQAKRLTMKRQGFWQINVFPRDVTDDFMPTIPESDVGLDLMLNVIGEMMMTKRPELTWKRYKGYLDTMYTDGTFNGI